MTASTTTQFLDWDKIELEEVNSNMHRKIVSGERMTIARIYLKDGYLVPQHSHENEQITQVLSGVLRFRLGSDRNEVVSVGPGEVIVIPPNAPHEALAVGDVEEIDSWSPVRADWLDGTDYYLQENKG